MSSLCEDTGYVDVSLLLSMVLRWALASTCVSNLIVNGDPYVRTTL